MNKPSKTQLTLKYLREAGVNGISGLDLDKKVGQKRTAARIQDLEDLGYIIKAEGYEQYYTRTKKYTLLTSPYKTAADIPYKKHYVFDPIQQVFREV